MKLSERIRSWFAEPSAATEQRTSFDDLVSMATLGGPLAASGRSVTPETALRQATVFACVRLLSTSVGMLPLILYRRLEPRGRERATNHPLYTVLHDLPNPELTALELYENMVGHLALWGNAYCEIEYDGAGRRRALWPLRPDCVTVRTEGNRRVYDVWMPDGQTVTLERWRVWHVRGWGTDAWTGKSPIALAREAIGLALGTEDAGARFFANDSRPGGILKTAGTLNDQAKRNLKASWESAHGGLAQRGRVAVLEQGIEWQQIGIPNEDAQWLQTRAFQRTEIYAIFGVKPHMVGDMEKVTSWGTGIEEQGIDFITYSLGPYTIRFRQSIFRDLLSPAERPTYYAEFLTDALVRGNLEKRYAAYATGRNGGWLSVNEIRESENMNPIPGGDVYLEPLNMTAVGQEPAEPDADDEAAAAATAAEEEVDDEQTPGD
jgi:HK97 family phage portal protein